MRCRPWISYALLAAILVGCAGYPRPHPESTGPQRRVTPAAIAFAQQQQLHDFDAALSSLRSRAHSGQPRNVLILSSGGQNGAFGAGLVRGWGASGTRPEFDLVTGVSTGALIAVFAFLGTEGDATLEAMYTGHGSSDFMSPRFWVEMPNANSYANAAPLRRMIAKYITDDVITAIGREAARGRVLLISTTNLDLGNARIWNLTALAADDSTPFADRAARFREIVVAAVSIPTLVEPAFIDGCMHADGGLVRQAFLADPEGAEEVCRALRPADGPGPRVWVVVNRRLGSPAVVVRNHMIPITARTVQVMIDSLLDKDIAEIERLTTLSRGEFSLAALPPDPTKREAEGFLDPVYMKEVHALGFKAGETAATWIRDLAALRQPAPSAATGP